MASEKNTATPQLSIIVIFHNMRREAQRTLFTLSRQYQRDVAAIEYEVIAIDNGSTIPLDKREVEQLGSEFCYYYHKTRSPSPVEAVNLGVSRAKGKKIAVIVDGARMASPRLIKQTLTAMRLRNRTFVASLSWHLGPDIQPRSIQLGYNQQSEDGMLAAVDWKSDGYLLFGLSTLAPSSKDGFTGGFPVECSWFAMNKEDFEDLGGFDIRFQSPGGGLCNHEFRNRAVEKPGILTVLLLGEGVFHQVHGGFATNSMPKNRPHRMFAEEYLAIKGHKCSPVQPREWVYFGHLGGPARKHLGPTA